MNLPDTEQAPSHRLRIGTRNSPLALWQAERVSSLLRTKGVETVLVHIKSEGEIDLSSPLYAMGIQGVFTRALDKALLNKEIDVAVHSLKDLPTQLAEGLSIAATPLRDSPYDTIVYKDRTPDAQESYTVATSSLRRRAQWLHRYPHHKTEVIRGNINTRLEKLRNNPQWDGAIFASAGIDRLDLSIPCRKTLDWMLPSPAQGAMAVVCRSMDEGIVSLCQICDDENTMLATSIERAFLRQLMGGCSMPIGAYARIANGKIIFEGNILTIDGQKKAETRIETDKDAAHTVSALAVNEIMKKGGRGIVEILKKTL